MSGPEPAKLWTLPLMRQAVVCAYAEARSMPAPMAIAMVSPDCVIGSRIVWLASEILRQPKDFDSGAVHVLRQRNAVAVVATTPGMRELFAEHPGVQQQIDAADSLLTLVTCADATARVVPIEFPKIVLEILLPVERALAPEEVQ